MRGRTVFITGAARGIGAASAERLHARGANVALVGLEPERLQALARRLGEDRVSWHEADVTDLEALRGAVEETVARFGGIDVAIANAGIAFSGTLAGAPVEQVERTLAVNFLGVWRTDRAVIDRIAERRGYLLNIASLSGVGCAYFGFIDTDLVKAAYAQPSAELVNSRTPAFVRNPAPIGKAVDAIERGIERRAARVLSPRWIGAAIALRGLIQPLTEMRALKDQGHLAEAMRLADLPPQQDAEPDPLLGVSAQALATPAPSRISR